MDIQRNMLTWYCKAVDSLPMEQTNKAVTDSLVASETRADYIHNGAFKCAISQGYSADTAYAFAAWAQDYAPEVQGFTNLFNAYMSMQD